VLNNKTKLLLVSVVSIFVITLVGLWIHKEFFTLYINSTNPSKNSVPKIVSFIDLKFNKDISSVGFVKSLPSSDVLDSYSINNKVIRLEIGDVLNNPSISFMFEDIKSTDGYAIDDLEIEFKLVDMPESEIPKDQLEDILRKQDINTDKNSDPILMYVPYSTLNYSIKPNLSRTRADGSVIVDLDVKVELSMADVRYGVDKKKEDYRNQVIEYLNSKGVKVEDYRISYDYIVPSLY